MGARRAERSERKMREIDYNALLVDTTDSIGIVTDAETHELLYMNKTALHTYDLSSEADYQGKRCYQVLQGESEPCQDCPIKRTPKGELYRWEQFVRRNGRWQDNTGCAVEKGGRTLYVKIARDITARKEGRAASDGTTSMEDTLSRCLRVMAREKDFDVAVRLFLEAVARHYKADRACIFEFDFEARVFNNTFEWCEEGVSAEIENAQNIPPELTADWVRAFERGGELSIHAIGSEVDPDTEEYRLLKARGITGLMAVAFPREDHTIAGFLGVDNPKRRSGDMQLLCSVTDLLHTELEKRQLLKELERLSYTDVLTGAYNRRQYEHYMKRYASRELKSMGVIVVNINGMKSINTTFGTERGDAVIGNVCKTLRDWVPGQIFRISGDQFVALCDNVPRDSFQESVSDLRLSFRKKEDCPVSIGCAWKAGDIMVEKMVEQAEELMYAEKRSYYDTILKNGDRITRRGTAEEVLREIEEKRFIIFFQPQIDLAQGAITGAEALVRKLRDDGNLISPDKFIPFYEAAGVIRYVDLHVLDLACAALRKWEEAGKDLRISVNFSRLTLMEPQIVDEIVTVCRKNHVSPAKITVEMTESINQIDEEHLRRLIDRLKEEKFRISLDDFGSNYSNLAILSTIEFDEVKFDRTLIRNIETNRKSQVVIRNGLKMCEELDGSISVAEGIETKEQKDLLIRYGCYIGQGYYFSRPISQAAFTALLKEENICCQLR